MLKTATAHKLEGSAADTVSTAPALCRNRWNRLRFSLMEPRPNTSSVPSRRGRTADGFGVTAAVRSPTSMALAATAAL